MRLIDKQGIRYIEDKDSDIYLDPIGQIGYTQKIFQELDKNTIIPIKKGVYRFKNHEEMNKQ